MAVTRTIDPADLGSGIDAAIDCGLSAACAAAHMDMLRWITVLDFSAACAAAHYRHLIGWI